MVVYCILSYLVYTVLCLPAIWLYTIYIYIFCFCQAHHCGAFIQSSMHLSITVLFIHSYKYYRVSTQCVVFTWHRGHKHFVNHFCHLTHTCLWHGFKMKKVQCNHCCLLRVCVCRGATPGGGGRELLPGGEGAGLH